MRFAPLFALLACDPTGAARGAGDAPAGHARSAAPPYWFEGGEPEIDPPSIDWLDAGAPPVAPPARACPSGWTELALDAGGHHCSPWPDGAREECASETAMHLPGEEGCAEVGSACPTGDWPADAGEEATLYVADRPLSSGPGGDGSRDDPFDSLTRAIRASSPGDTIVLGAGTFSGDVEIPHDLTLRGLCPALTEVVGVGDGGPGAVITHSGGSLTVRDLRITDAVGPGIVSTGATLGLEGVVIDRLSTWGLYADATAVTLQDVLIAEVDPRPADQELGWGIGLEGSASLTGDDVTVANTHEYGVRALWASSVVLTDLSVFGVSPQASDDSAGRSLSLYVPAGDEVDLERVVIEGGFEYSLVVGQEGDLVLTDAWIEGLARGSEDYGGGVFFVGGGRMTATGVTVRESYGTAMTCSLCSWMEAEDLVVQVTYAPPEDGGGAGVYASQGSNILLSRADIRDTAGPGVSLSRSSGIAVADTRITRPGPAQAIRGLRGGSGIEAKSSHGQIERVIVQDAPGAGVDTLFSTMDAEDLYVSGAGLNPRVIGFTGFGVVAETGTVNLYSSVIEDTWAGALAAINHGSLHAEDVVIRRVYEHPFLGVGAFVFTRGEAWDRNEVQLTRVVAEEAVGAGVLGRRTNLSLSHVRMWDVESNAEGRGGYGVQGVVGDAWMDQVAISHTREAGVALVTGTHTLTDLLVSGVRPQACASAYCPEETQASGVYLSAGARGTVGGLLVEDAEGAGLQVRGAATVSGALLRANAVAIDAVGGGLLRAGVVLDDNGVDEATEAGPEPTL